MDRGIDRGQMLAQSMSKMEPSDLVVGALLMLILAAVIFLLSQTPSVFKIGISFSLLAMAGVLLVVFAHHGAGHASRDRHPGIRPFGPNQHRQPSRVSIASASVPAAPARTLDVTIRLLPTTDPPPTSVMNFI